MSIVVSNGATARIGTAARLPAGTPAPIASVWTVGREDAHRDELGRLALAEAEVPWDLQRREEQGTGGELARLRAYDLGPVRMVDCAAAPVSGRRGSSEIRRTDAEWVVAVIHRAGRSRFSQGDCRAEPRAGSVIVWHSVAPAEFAITETLVKRSIFVPRDLLGGMCRSLDHRCGIELSPSHPAVGLFCAVAGDVARRVADLDTDARIASGRVLVELLSTCLAPHRLPGRTVLQAGLFARARDHIEHRIGDPALRPATVAVELRVPLRTLQDVFAQRGQTIWGYIRELRLDRCNAELQRGTDRTVMEIAFAHGFTNAAHFTRCFRERYGVTPRDLRAAVAAM